MKCEFAVRWFVLAILGAILTVSIFGCMHTPGGPESGEEQVEGENSESRDPILALKRMPGDPEPEGLYSLDNEVAFNVLDGAVWDEKRGTISLYGHWDDRYAGPRIFWLQHLAEMLDRPDPEFSLHWTPDSEKRVDRFLETSETPAEIKRVTDQWGDVIDERAGTVSAVGRFMLPAMGLTITDNGSAPGQLGVTLEGIAGRDFRIDALEGGEYLLDGVQVAQDAAPSRGGDLGVAKPRPNGTLPKDVRIKSVRPGSPAELGGLQAGDVIAFLDGDPVLDILNFTHQIRARGAGAEVQIAAKRGGVGNAFIHTVKLEAFTGDAWAGLSSNDVACLIFRSAGMPEAADATYWCSTLARVSNGPEETHGFDCFIAGIGLQPTRDRLYDEVKNHTKSEADAQKEIIRAIAVSLDSAYRLADKPGTAAWDAEFRRTGDFLKALEVALGEVEKRRKASLASALKTLFSRPTGIQIPPELVEMSYGLHSEVAPEYLGVDPTSQLARVMFESDYIGKRLVNSPGLAATVPGYMTSFEFNRRNPRFRVNAGKATTYRMWISCGKLDAAESTDGSTLEVRDARMQFNIRELDGNKRDLPPTPGGYEALLTSLYDPLSLEFPVLHEVRECAKLAAIARWAKAKNPGLRLPKEGRAAWHGPATMPGLIWMYLYPPTGPSKFDETVMATGGCSLKLPIEAFPNDPGVVSLSESSLTKPVSIDPQDPAPAGLAGIAPGKPIEPEAAVRWEYLPAVKGSREALTINPKELQKTDPTEYEARQAKLRSLIDVLNQLHDTKVDLDRNQVQRNGLRTKREDLDWQIRNRTEIINEVDSARGGFRTPQTSAFEQARKTLAECRREIGEANFEQALFDDATARNAREHLQACGDKLDEQWKKFKERADLGSRVSKWLTGKKEVIESRIERSRMHEELFKARLEAATHAEAMKDLENRRAKLLQQRDQLLKELKIID